MKSGSVCEVCGDPLSSLSKSFVCGDACRKRKSRMRQDAALNLIRAKNAIREVIKGLELDVIDTSMIHDEFNPLADLYNNLVRAHNARLDREKAKS